MSKCNGSDKNLVSLCDTLVLIVGKIVIATRGDGFRFSSKLIEIRGEGSNPELWFENKSGLKWMTRRDNISDIREIGQRGP